MSNSKQSSEQELARQIFTAAASAAIADDPSTADFEGLAEYAFIAAKAFGEVEKERRPKLPKIQQQHLDAAKKK